MGTYLFFSNELREWFFELKKDHPEAHISCAGRGKIEQGILFNRGATRAKWGESAHNYNAALDLFEMDGDNTTIYDEEWFMLVIAPRVEKFNWYGKPGATFHELPHVELKDWRERVARGELKLVE
jgi:hypothetical protein